MPVVCEQNICLADNCVMSITGWTPLEKEIRAQPSELVRSQAWTEYRFNLQL